MISGSNFSMSSLPKDFLLNVEMNDSVISLSSVSSDSVSSENSTSVSDNFLTINGVCK